MNKKLVLVIIGSACAVAFLCGSIVSNYLSAQNKPLLPNTQTQYSSFVFTKDLSYGDSNQDVRQLQRFLNTDPNTVIAKIGIGSRGNESTFFGQLTQQAVVRFQQKNKLSVTGFVDTSTRNTINQLMTKAFTATTTKSLPTQAVSKVLSKNLTPRLFMLQPQQIKKGGTFNLVGLGFQTQNTVHIGQYVFSGLVSRDGTNISLTIPATSTVPNGTYTISVENSGGNSQVFGRNISLVITDSPGTSSVISNVSPANVTLDQTVTVTGSGFASSGNSIVSGFGSIDNLSSSGTQISFIPRSLFSLDFIKRAVPGKAFELDFYVVSDNGVSNVKGSVMVKI